jgi:peptidyl-prolyl cis-trans isomerase SurA
MGTRKTWSAAVAAGCALALLCGAGCKGHAGGGEVMARVNGHKILRSEVETYYHNQTQGQPEPSAEQAEALRLNILHDLIDDEILLQRAQKLGLMATDQEVDDKLKEVHAPFTNEEFDQRMKQRGITLEEFKQDLRRSITVDKVLNKEIVSKISVTDADVTNYYNQHKAEFNLIVPQYHLAQILVTTRPDPQVRNLKNDKAQNEAEAKTKVAMLENKLTSGEDFAKLAMSYSEQPDTAASGGDLGFIPENSLQGDPAAYAAISRLKAGEVTPPLPAADPQSKQLAGFRIIKLIAKEPAGQRELNDPRVQQAIREQLRTQREQVLKTAYYESMRDSSSVENYLAEQILKNNGQ